MHKIHLIKKSLLLSSGFMSMVRRGGEVWNSLLNEYRQLEQKGYNEKQITKYWSKKYNFNEFDVSYVSHESKSNDTNLVEQVQEQDNQLDNSNDDYKEQEEQIQEPKYENNIEEKKENVKEKIEEYAPYYETKFIKFRELQTSDLIYIDDELWCVVKKRGLKAYVQNILDKSLKVFRKNVNDKIEILTDESVSQIINEFKDENLEEQLPNILKI